MPAKSKSQQKLMGMVYAYKKGKLDTKNINKGLLDKIKKIAKDINLKDAKDFAETKHNNISENSIKTFESFKRTSDKHKEVTAGKGIELRKNLNYYDIIYTYYQDFNIIDYERKSIQLLSIGYFEKDGFYYLKINGDKDIHMKIK